MDKETFVKRLAGIDELEKELELAEQRENALYDAIRELVNLCEHIDDSLSSSRYVDVTAYGSPYDSFSRSHISSVDFSNELERIRRRLNDRLDRIEDEKNK